MSGRRALLMMMIPLLVAAQVARGQPVATAEPREPSVAELQAAALRTSRLEPERIDAWERRIRLSSLLPSLRLRLGRGGTALQASSDLDGSTRLTLNNGDTWTFEIAATWNLDRLVWHPDEIRLAREAQRMAARREKLLAEVATLDAERRRLRASALDTDEATLRLAEIESILDGLTGNALARAAPPPPRASPPAEDEPAP